MTGLDRRDFIRRSALAGGVLLAPSLSGLISCTDPTAANSNAALRNARKGEGGYGPLSPSKDVDGLISLPTGFHAALLSTAGDEMVGGVVPNAFDGMAAFMAGAGMVRLVRNHELHDEPRSSPTPFGTSPYDSLGSTVPADPHRGGAGSPARRRSPEPVPDGRRITVIISRSPPRPTLL